VFDRGDESMTESMTESKKLQQVFLDTVCYGQSFYKKNGGVVC
jgi:hypothetical protein